SGRRPDGSAACTSSPPPLWMVSPMRQTGSAEIDRPHPESQDGLSGGALRDAGTEQVLERDEAAQAPVLFVVPHRREHQVQQVPAERVATALQQLGERLGDLEVVADAAAVQVQPDVAPGLALDPLAEVIVPR